MSAQIVVPITRVRRAEPGTPPLPLPRYMTPGSAGMDIAAALTDTVVLAPLQRAADPARLAGFAHDPPSVSAGGGTGFKP